MSPKKAKFGVGLGVLAGVGIASYMSGRRAVPALAGTVRIEGLSKPVEVLRDRYGVPHIYAASEHDLFVAQGYVHAADRLFQMDAIRRLAAGRMAEIVGEPALASDRLIRTLGFAQIAEAEISELSPETLTTIESYCVGVNAFIAANRRKLPVEFRLLGYTPEPWEPHHSLAPARLMALGLCGNWESELVRAEIDGIFGEDVLHVLDDDAERRPFPAVINTDILGELATAARDATATFGPGGGIGSNNWVIGPRRTATGGALLANDPHLDLQLPSVWYEQLLHTEGYHVRGYCVAGVPGVILGNNDRISWGFTNSCADVQDLYVEDLDLQAGTYLDTDGERKQLTTRVERIKVKGGATERLTVHATRRGPIITDALPAQVDRPLALRWDCILQPRRIVDALMTLNRAQNWEEFRDAMRLWSGPAQNVVYADVEGNIGFQHSGEVPIRAKGNGTIPHNGSDPDGEWIGTIPFEDHPWSFNPSSDRIVTANDKIVGDEYEHFISCEWMNGYRGDRIRSLIDESDGHTVDRQNEIQCDIFSIPGRELGKLVGRLSPQPTTENGKDLMAALVAWDGVSRVDDDGAIAYRLLIRAIQEEVFGFLGSLLPLFLGYSRTDQNGYWALFGRSTPRLLHDIGADDRALLELGAMVAREGRGKELREAPGDARAWTPSGDWRECLARAIDRAGERYGGSAPDPQRETPGSMPRGHRSSGPLDRLVARRRRYHRLRLQHPLGVVPGLSHVANLGPFPVPGDPDTVWQQSSFNNPMNEYAQVGPSKRRVVDMSNLDNSTSILAGGQSGHPASPHYVDQVSLWRDSQTRPAPFTRKAVEQATAHRQDFQPA